MRAALVILLAIGGLLVGAAPAVAEGEGSSEGSAEAHHEGSAAPVEEHHEGSAAPAAEPHEGSAEEHHEGAAAPAEVHHEGSAAPAEHHQGAPAEHHEDGPAAGTVDDEGEVVTDPFDEDGDGKMEPEELADKQGFEAAFKDIPSEPDEAALEARPEEDNLKPSMTVEQFRGLVRWSKKVVLEKMEAKMARKAAKRMNQFAMMVGGISLLGIFLLLMPLGLAKKYPGKGGLLFKYSALAALTFFVTVNLFGGVLLGLRTAQAALSTLANPSVAIAAGTFDTLDSNAEDYAIMGKELFGPALEQLKSQPDEPVSIILENGTKVVKDAKVFLSIAKMFKKIKFLLDYLPIILFLITMALFFKAIWPTLREIIQLPARAAEGAVTGGDVVKRAMGRVVGELKATLCTIGVLAVLTLISSMVLSEIVGPAIAALLDYFSLAVTYLLFVKDAASGMVFLALFGVVLFLVLNLATLILSTAFFLGKSQKIFQARFNGGVPLATHARYFKWGAPSVLFVQIFPWLFVVVASRILLAINDSLTNGEHGAAHIAWGKLLLAGPAFLVVAYLVSFWAARGIKAIRFLQSYKVKVPPSAPV
jgi:hypothetical protein